MDIVDEHAPKKQKYQKKESPPFMNSELRRAIYKKKMLHNQFKQEMSQTRDECPQRNWSSIRHI